MFQHVLIAVFAAFGTYEIVGRGHITQGLRNLLAPWPLAHELMTCAQCSGFWYGVSYAAALWATGPLSLSDWIILLSIPAITSGTTLFLNDLLDLCNTLREKETPRGEN